MSRSMIAAALLLCCLGGSQAAFSVSSGNSTGNTTTTPPLSAWLLLDGPQATYGIINITVGSITNYTWTTLTLGAQSNSSGTGAIVLWVDPSRAAWTDTTNPQAKNIMGSYNLVYNFTASNLVGSLGYAGVKLSALWTALQQGQIYATVSTMQAPGAISMPLMPMNEVYTAELFGSNQSPPIMTEAYGTSTLTINSDFTNATVELVIRDTPAYFMSHIHLGNANTSGAILLWINPLAAAYLSSPPSYFDVGIAMFTETFNASALVGYSSRTSLVALANLARNMNIYANVHTEAYPNGIIRGQYMGPMY